MNIKRPVQFVLTTVTLITAGTQGISQTSIIEESLDVIPTGGTTEVGFRNGSFVAVPIPFSNPTIGNGLAGGGALLFSTDHATRTSSIGLGGFKSDNGSKGIAFGADLNLNKYSASILAGNVDLYYDFAAGSNDIPLEQSGDLYKLEFSYGFSEEFSLGVGLQYAETSLSTSFGGALPIEISAALDLEVFKYGLISEYDSRDSDLYPTTGSLVTLDVFWGEVSGGFGRDYEKAVFKGSYFQPISHARDVFALSATFCKASRNAPFFDSCSIGLTDGLRGFSVTDYIGNRLVSAQAEYRGRFGNSRLGYVAFAGAGSVDGTLTSKSGVHAAVGAGLRYRLSKSFPVDFSFDVTTNSENDTLYYIYVGQSF